ncbi:MAG: hypothetical protein AAGA22_07800, partial [Pseudomonadota bacterium]
NKYLRPCFTAVFIGNLYPVGTCGTHVPSTSTALWLSTKVLASVAVIRGVMVIDLRLIVAVR